MNANLKSAFIHGEQKEVLKSRQVRLSTQS